MNEQQSFFSESRKKVEDYVNDQILLLRLQTAEKISRITAAMFTFLVLALLAFFILFFLSFMAGQFLGEKIRNTYAGYGIVALFYVLLFVLISLRKKYIEKKIADMMIGIFFEKTSDDDDTEITNEP